MKKGILSFVLAMISIFAFAQQQKAPEWTNILSNQPETFRTQLISSSEKSVKVNVQVPGFYTTTVSTPKGDAKVVTMPKALSTAHAGEPDVPMTGIPVMIGDNARMDVRVVNAKYMDFENIEIAPSKGDFPRSIDPETVPYTYGECYDKDAFFPAQNLDIHEPYIIRDFRGQNMAVYPFAYNPVTKTLRVYYDMTVEMYKVDDNGANAFTTRKSNTVKLDSDFKSVYQRHFINYESGMKNYTPLDEDGDLLIICYDSFMSYMEDFVNWKKTRGINTTMVGTTTAGSSYTAIKNYIQSQYNANNNLTHVLLVGDVAQIPGYSYSGGGSSYSGLGDNAYGQIVGSDIYNDLFIGRFSAQTAAQVTTQVNRVITYERDLTTSATWLQNADGIARKEGGSGHNSEDDYQHMDVIRTDLLGYGYNTVYQDYENLSGYTGTASSISSHINSGVGIVNYTNHGNNQLWGVASYSNTQVNQLTNGNKLPFIWSVACLVGKYDNTSTSYGSNYTIGQNNDCFAEAWMHATMSSSDLTPTGAVGALMSYISQPWIPPMWAHDECIDILCELKSNNIKHTWGGTSINGLFGIFDNYSTSDNSAVGTYQAWVLYGDPSMMLRTKTPQANSVTHAGTIALGDSSYSITTSNGNGAVATITDANHNILGKATVANNKATINISGTLTANQELTLCVFGYNKVTYLGTITVTGGTKYNITASANPTAGGSVSGAGEYYENTSCTLTATANAHYEFTRWTKNGSQVSTNNPYTFTVTGAADYVAQFTALTAHTVTCSAVQNGTISASPTTAYKGETVTLTATPASGYYFNGWTVKDANSNSITVDSNNQFTMPDSNVTVSATFVTGYNVTLASVMNGTISANPAAGPAGMEVTLTATPASGYVFDSWLVYNTNDVTQTVTVSNNKFTMPAYDVTVVGFFGAQAGGDVTVGSGTSTSQYLPTYVWYNYCLSQQIYTASEINNAGTITAISFYWYGQSGSATSSGARNLKIYMSHTSNSNLSSAWIQESTSHLVYDGTQTFNAIGWHTITLDTPFQYDGTSNLVITVDDNTGSYTVSAKHYFRTYSTGENRARVMCNDDTNPDPLGTVSTTISSSDPYNLLLTSNAQIKFSITSAGSSASLSASPTSLQGFTYPEGNGPSAYQTVALVGANLDANVTVSAPTAYEVCLTENGTYASSLSIAPTSGNVQKMVYVRLKAGLAQGNYNNKSLTFTSGSVSQTVTLSGTVSQGDGTYYTITVAAEPEVGGAVTGGNTYKEGTTATLTATANAGYTFQNWTLNDNVVSTNATYSFEVNAAGNYIANFTRNSYTITVTQAANGTISADKEIAYAGDIVTLTENANNGYFFSGWEVLTANNQIVAVSNDNTFVMPDSNVTVTASFAQGFTITLANTANGTVTANKENALPGETITLTATPDTDYFLSTLLVLQSGDVDNSVTVTNNQFTMPSFDVTVFAIFKANEIEEVTVGSGTSTNSYIPTYAYYKYSFVEEIYTAAEIGSAGNITAIAFKVSNSKSTSRTLDVYMKHTTRTAFSSRTDWESFTTSEKVFSGSVTFAASGWTTITFDTPFEYDGESNVIIAVDDNTGSYVSSASNAPQFYVYSTGDNRAIRVYNDSTNPNPSSPGSTSYSTTYNAVHTSNNQITFTVSHPSNGATLSVSPNSLANFSYEVGDGPSRKKTLDIIGIDITDDIVVTAPADFEVADVADGTYGSTVTIPASSKGNRETVTYDFEDGWQGWTTFQGTTTSAHSWMHNTEYTAYDSNGDQIVPECHDSSSGMMLSESYISASTSGGSGTAVTPDNYLVSPQIELGGSFSFYAASRMSNYPAEKFTVYVSQTGNTSASNFTTDLLTVTLSDNSWQQYTVNLSAYSGQGYVAIRHYDCTDQHLLYIDDVTVVGPSEDPGTTTTPTALLTANVYVRMKAGLAEGSYDGTLTVETGEVTSNVSLSGTVTENTSGLVAQTSSFTSGWNWWTMTVNGDGAEALSQLEAALGSNGVTISNMAGKYVSYNAQYGIWTGNLTSLEVGQMYKIKTSTPCNITMEGAVIDPSEYSITLNPGNNWIGFVGSSSMSVNAALANLTPTSGDVISNSDGKYATYYPGAGWVGSLKTLEPGNGYIYKSKASSSKSFTFGNGAKAGDGIITKDDFHWAEPDAGAFDCRNRITGEVKIDGVLQQSDNIELAAFVGDEVRGVVRLMEAAPSVFPDHYYAFLTVFFNTVGETVTLKAYDHATGTEYDNCLQEFVITEDEYDFGGFGIDYYLEFETLPPFGPDYPWVPSTSYSGNGMSLMAQIQIDGVPVDRDSWEVGAFCNGECRGDVTPLLDMTAQSLGYLASMTINGNDGDVINFYLYDTQAGQVFQGECPTTVVMENDGFIGQDIFNDLFVLNFLSTPFWTMDIEAYTTNGGWYLITTPLTGVAPTNVTNMLSNSYDLYYFDQEMDLEWVNYKPGTGNVNPGFDLEPGKGYLYANSENVQLVFAGTPYEGDGTVEIFNVEGHRSAGWNLIGNPFTVDAILDTDRNFYVMNTENGREDLILATRDEIHAMEGIFVYTEEEEDEVTFIPANTGKSDKNNARLVLNVSRGDGNAIDRVIVRMDEGEMLPKYMMDETHAHMSIPMDGDEYAVVNGVDAEMFPVNFKADRMGTYTISIDIEGVDVDYLHLIDNIDGVDVDMLVEGSYTFVGVPDDMVSRFVLRFNATGYDNVDEIFAYQNGSDIIVDGNGTLEVYDVMGRFVSSQAINGVETIQALPMGVYIFRMVGDTVRTQKIVVR